MIRPYVKNVKIFACPSRPNENGGWLKNPIGYGYNLQDADWTSTDSSRLALANIPSPADAIVLGESSWGIQWISADNMGSTVFAGVVHGQVTNWVFADGHAKTLKFSRTIWPHVLWNWNGQYPFGPAALNWNSEKDVQDWIAAAIEGMRAGNWPEAGYQY